MKMPMGVGLAGAWLAGTCVGFAAAGAPESVVHPPAPASLSAVGPTAPRLSVSRDGAGLRIAWEGGGILEESAELSGPWRALEGASSPYAAGVPAGRRFYRVHWVQPLTVVSAGDGRGRVRSVPAGIDCGGDCAETYAVPTRVTLTAEADAGSAFAGWEGDCAGTGPCELSMEKARRVTARFTAGPAEGTRFINGDFEQGPGVGWLQRPSNLIYTAQELGVAAYSGRYAAWLGYDRDDRRSAAMGQVLTLPGRTPIYLNFALWLHSEELCDPPWWDSFGVYVGDQAIVENARLCQGNTGGTGWRRISLDLSAFAGRTVLIGFEISSADTLASVALIDDVAIGTAPW